MPYFSGRTRFLKWGKIALKAPESFNYRFRFLQTCTIAPRSIESLETCSWSYERLEITKLFIADNGARNDYGVIYEDYGEILPVLSWESSCEVFQDHIDIAERLQGFYYLCSTLDYK